MSETVGTADFVITYSGPTVQDAFTVDFTVSDGSATAPDDYTVATADTSVTFPAGTQDGDIQVVTVNIVNDDLIEGDENLSISLSNVSNAPFVAIIDGTATGTIDDDEDDDPNVGIAFGTPEVTVTEGTDALATFTVTFTGNIAPGESVTVDYVVNDGTAVDGTDFTVQSGTITFDGANTTFEVEVPILDDDVIEATETFTVLLSNVVSNIGVGIVGSDTATGTILDDDNEPGTNGLTINDIVVNEEDGTAVLTVTLNGQYQEGFTVGFTTGDGTAVSGEDYESLVGTVTFSGNDGEQQAITITIIDDELLEVLEDFNVILTDVSYPAVDILDGTGVVTIVDDESDFRDPGFGDVTILCGDEVPPVPVLEDFGGCSEPVVEFSEETVFPEDTDDYFILRTWNVSDECGNTATFEQTIFILQYQLEEISIEICVEDGPIDLLDYLPEAFDASGTFEITQGDTVLDGTNFDPSGLELGEYLISYSAQDGPCQFFADYVIDVNSDCVECSRDRVVVNKTVTVNGDGVNDFLEISGVEYCPYTFGIMIFNRWGDKVFEVDDYRNDWGGASPGGSFGNSGTLPSGTYYYIISIFDSEANANLEPINGYIYLGTN